MKPTLSLAQRMSLTNLAVTATLLILLGIVAWCGWRWHLQSDWTFYGGNTLSDSTLKTLDAIDGIIRIDVYLNDEEQQLKQKIAQLIRLYRQYKPSLQLRFIDPVKNPQALRNLGVEGDSAVFVHYRGRSEQLTLVNESTLTNALLQLAHEQEQWISVLSGHGERSPIGKANYDFGTFGDRLQKRRQKVYPLNIGQLDAIPDNTALLVIAAPRTPLLAGETEMVLQYIRHGGNLLWLTEPDAAALPELSAELGIHTLPGVIVDHKAQLYSVNDPSFVLVTDYPTHPLTAGQHDMTLFPQAAALQRTAQDDFKAEPVLVSSEQSWTETGPIAGTIEYNPEQGETRGPLDLGIALTRMLDNGGEQRIAVIGDGDFLSNAYLGNVGNQELGYRLINWLTHQDRFIAIPIKRAPDAQLNIDLHTSTILAYGFLVILPALLFGSGFLIWFQRRRH
jgi:hypothetical protein